MIKVLHLSPNDYRHWLTYEGEYLNEAMALHPELDLKVWGRSRPGYEEGLPVGEIIQRLYGQTFPDVVMVSNTLLRSKDPSELRFFEGMEEVAKKCVVIMRTADPWRFEKEFLELRDRFDPAVWLVHSSYYVDHYNDQLKDHRGQAVMLPYCFGRRYVNLGMEREFDLGMIGRCEHEGENLLPKQFQGHWYRKEFKIFYEGGMAVVRKGLKPENYISRYSNIVLNLNRCLASWNSPVKIKVTGQWHTPFRYLEAPACGAVSITPTVYPELLDYYIPAELLLNCEDSLDRARDLVRGLRRNVDQFLDLQAKAYAWVMGNHQAWNRVEFLVGLMKDPSKKADPRDYYSVSP